VPPLYRAQPSPTALPQAGVSPLTLDAACCLSPLEQVPLEHCDRCGCRESYLGSNQSTQSPLSQWRSPQQSVSLVQMPPLAEQQVPFWQKPKPTAFPQHCVSAVQEPPGSVKHCASKSETAQQIVPLQHRLTSVQELPCGRHSGVVEVVLVVVEVVGVVVDVEVVLVGVVVEVLVDVEVVLVEVVLVVLLVDVLVEVVVVLSHGPRSSPWRRWPLTALWGTSMVCSSGVPGLWQMVTFRC
jgi:hypothetical protein